MNASTTTADTLLRQAWPWVCFGQAGRLAPRDLDILFQVCLGPSVLRVPVSQVSWRFRHEPSRIMRAKAHPVSLGRVGRYAV
jgi:hypothetical protein